MSTTTGLPLKLVHAACMDMARVGDRIGLTADYQLARKPHDVRRWERVLASMQSGTHHIVTFRAPLGAGQLTAKGGHPIILARR